MNEKNLKASQRFLNMIGVLKYPNLKFKLDTSILPNQDISPKFNESDNLFIKKFRNLELIIGYKFNNCELLIKAFTHVSFRKIINKALYLKFNETSIFKINKNEEIELEKNEKNEEKEHKMNVKSNEIELLKGKIDFHCAFINKYSPEQFSYERLEFLGDSILDFIFVKYLFENFKNEDPSISLKKKILKKYY